MESIYNLPQGFALVDACLTVYGSLDYLIKLSSENSIEAGQDFTDEFVKLNYDNTVNEGFADSVSVAKALNETQKISGLTFQTTIDLCLMATCGLDGFIKFANNNNVNSTYSKNQFKFFSFSNDSIEDLNLRKTIKSNNIVFNTGLEVVSGGFLLQENGKYLLQENLYKIKI